MIMLNFSYFEENQCQKRKPSIYERLPIIQNIDAFQDIDQEHNIDEWSFDTFYNEDIREFKGKRKRKTRTALTQAEMSNVYKDNKEGLEQTITSQPKKD
jgi:hypothetical protein